MWLIPIKWRKKLHANWLQQFWQGVYAYLLLIEVHDVTEMVISFLILTNLSVLIVESRKCVHSSNGRIVKSSIKGELGDSINSIWWHLFPTRANACNSVCMVFVRFGGGYLFSLTEFTIFPVLHLPHTHTQICQFVFLLCNRTKRQWIVDIGNYPSLCGIVG